jgi:hypothetical protein
MRDHNAREHGPWTHEPDRSAEAVKTLRCLLSYARLRHLLTSGSSRAERQRILRYCKASYDADVEALRRELN